MKRIRRFMIMCLTLLFAVAVLGACSNKQDETNFKKYLAQDTAVKGKVGVLISALGQPEQYDFEFYDNYLQQIFNAAFPPILKFIILRDSGTVLRDPENLFAGEEFKPKQLMDCFGKTVAKDGTPYAQKEVKWVKPRKEGKAGHFLLKQKNDYIDIIEKTAIKVAASYYPRMPGNTVPYRRQHVAIFKEVEALLQQDFPGIPFCTAWDMYPGTIEKALEELIAQKVETIVVCDLFPVYSSLEEFNTLFVEIEHKVKGRAKLVFTPYVGAYGAFRKAYVTMAQDEIAGLPKSAEKLLVLTRHGMPEIPGEPYPELARIYYDNLQKEVERVVAGTNTKVVFADTEFAAEDDDPDNERLSSAEAFEDGLEKKYAAIVFVLVDFMTENTDTVFCAREEAMEAIHFEYEGMVPYTDFTQPFRTDFMHDTTRVIVAGTPVGDRYRPMVSQGIYEAVTTVLKGKAWPQLIMKN